MYVLVKKGCVDVLECGTAGECKKTKRELINAHSDLEDKLLIWSVAKYNSFFSCYTELELNYK